MNSLEKDGYIFYFDVVTKFFSTIIIKGIVHSRDGGDFDINSIKSNNNSIKSQFCRLEPEIKNNIYATNFFIEALCVNNILNENSVFTFYFNNTEVNVSTNEMLSTVSHIDSSINEDFFNLANENEGINILDIGGRARSGLLRSSLFDKSKITVLDIIPDDGVDVVADAHELSSHLKRNSFDFCMCISVFEHLIMPWKVVIEVNKVLKTGGLFFVATHQTIGMHDMPWDYYRFSDKSWDGLFNKYTGFDIIKRNMSGLNFITPFAWSKEKDYYEKSAGYESSAVLVRKISETSLEWPVAASDLVDTNYPS